MKEVVIAMLLLFAGFKSFSQSENESNVSLGFNFGVNYSNLIHSGSFPDNSSISNNMGFRLGAVTDFGVNDFLSISPKAELSINNCVINTSKTDPYISRSQYAIMPVSLSFMTDLVFKKKKEKTSPYFLLGPNVEFPLLDNAVGVSSTYQTGINVSVNCGIGVSEKLKNYVFSPELRYSFGLVDVNRNPELGSLYFHNVTLVFNFMN